MSIFPKNQPNKIKRLVISIPFPLTIAVDTPLTTRLRTFSRAALCGDERFRSDGYEQAVAQYGGSGDCRNRTWAGACRIGRRGCLDRIERSDRSGRGAGRRADDADHPFRKLKRYFLFAIAVIGLSTLADARILFGGGDWAAIERDGLCSAISRSELQTITGGDQARASVTFGRDRNGEVHFRLSRAARPGSYALLVAGGEPFQLVTRGADAWSRGPAQEAAVLAAIRRSGDLRVRFRTERGGFTDRYLLAGAPTAIDAAATACSRAR